MSTKITNKQVKIISNVDFNEKEIENAIIDAEKNEITNLDMPTKVSDLENDSGYTTTADVNSEIIANSSYMDNALQEDSFNVVTNDAITKGIEKNKVSVVDSFVDTLPSETLTLGQSVLNKTDNKIYKVVGEKQIEDYFFKINGSLSINNDDGCITGFSEENYISLADVVIEYTNPVWSNIKVNKLIFTLAPASISYTTTIFSIIRRDDNSVLFGVDYTSGYGGRLNIYTKKRDGTNVDSYTIYATVTNSRYELEITNSCYIKIVDRGKTIAIKYFGSLEPSTEVGDDFYYNIPADIKISSKKITSQQYTYTVGIQKLYGIESSITYQSGGMPGGGNIVYPSDNGVWNNGTELFSGKLVYNIANYGLYEYNGTNMVSLIPDMNLYQKKLAAGNNITISPEGYQNFSNSNYLSFNSTVDSTYSDDFFFKITINETNRLNTLLYSVFDTNKYGYIEITDENKLNCVWISGSSEMTFIGANYVFQPNKTYWIRLVQNRIPQQFYILEDNNYTIETVPKALSAWTYDARGLSNNLVVKLYANSTNYLGYNPTATANYFKGAIEEFSVGNIFTLSIAVEGTDFTNHGCLKGPVISAIVPVDSELSNISENAVQNKVIDAALRAMKPVIVTDSGATLPSVSGYQLNDTFLNTTDKKIYKAEMTIKSYELNTDVTNEGITVDLQTGIASGFVPAGGGVYTPKGIRHNNLNILWKEPITLNFHFNITETRDNQVIATLYQGGYEYKCVSFYIANDNKIYLTYTQGSGGSSTQSNIFLLADYQLLLNTEYFVEINKNGTNVTTTISTQGYNISPEYEETINNVEDWYPSDNYSYLIYGYYNSGPLSGGQSVFSGSIYLADSFGEFLLPVETISWDNGTSILNSTGYIDKANGILHYYESPDLISIGGGSGALAKKVYKFNSDNTSILDVSSDFTKIVDVLKNGVELVLTDDYTISNGVITFVTALSTTDKITVKGE